MTVSDYPDGDPESAKTSAKGFFGVDSGAFRFAAVGGLNAAVAHVVMARGTGPDNRTTQWSVNSIEQRTGISRPNAAKAVNDLLDRGIWKKIRDGQHPIYEAVPGDVIPGGRFTADEQAAIAAIREGKPVPYDSKNQSEQDSVVVRLRSRAGRSAGCMVLAAAHLKTKRTATTSTALARRR